MFLVFFAWYHGLAVGGISRMGQVQLLQPFLTLIGGSPIPRRIAHNSYGEFCVRGNDLCCPRQTGPDSDSYSLKVAVNRKAQ